MTPEIIGHRGARALFPENTLAGFSATLAAGCSHFEIDVGMTRDGVVVLSHDPMLSRDLTRTRDGLWLGRERHPIFRMSYAELQAYDVGRLRPGSRTAKLFPRQTPADGEAIPALETVLRRFPPARFTIEIKTYPTRPKLTAPPEVIADAVAAIVEQTGMADRVIIQSFDWRGPRHLRRSRPGWRYAWLTARSTRAWRGGQFGLPAPVVAEGGGTWSPHHRDLTERLLAKAHAAGLRVVPWTVNDPAAMVRFARWGVDGIITDDPVAALAALQPAKPG